MAAKSTVLDALKTLLTTAYTPPDSQSITWYRYPAEYSSVDTTTLPVGIVAEAKGTINNITRVARQMQNEWVAELLILLADGEFAYPSAASATAESLDDGWAIALADVLVQYPTINDTALSVGRAGQLMQYSADFYQWNAAPFWGVRILVPVTTIVEAG